MLPRVKGEPIPPHELLERIARGETSFAGMNLRGAPLVRAGLAGVELRCADLSGAHLRRADLHEAYLQQADLRAADLRRANLYHARLDGADLRAAQLEDVEWDRAVLLAANLYGARTTTRVTGASPICQIGDAGDANQLDVQTYLHMLDPSLREERIWHHLDFLRWLVETGRLQP